MGELEIRKQMTMKVIAVEYLPAIQEEKLEVSNFRKFPLSNILAFGVAFEPLVSAVHFIISTKACRAASIYQKSIRSAFLD